MLQWKKTFFGALVTSSLFLNTGCFYNWFGPREYTYREELQETSRQQMNKNRLVIVDSSVSINIDAATVSFQIERTPYYTINYNQISHGQKQFGSEAAPGLVGVTLGYAALAGGAYFLTKDSNQSAGNAALSAIGIMALLDLGMYAWSYAPFQTQKKVYDQKEIPKEQGIASNTAFTIVHPISKKEAVFMSDGMGYITVPLHFYSFSNGFSIRMPVGDNYSYILGERGKVKVENALWILADREAERQAKAQQLWERQKAQESQAREARIKAVCNPLQILATASGTTLEELVKGQVDKLIAKNTGLEESDVGRIRTFLDAYVAKKPAGEITIAMFSNEFDNYFKDHVSGNTVVKEFKLALFKACIPCAFTLLSR